MNMPLLLLAILLAISAQAGWAQAGRHNGPAGGPPGRGMDRPARDEARRDQGAQRRDEPRRREDPRDSSMSPAERRELRDQVRDHGRLIYQERP